MRIVSLGQIVQNGYSFRGNYNLQIDSLLPNYTGTYVFTIRSTVTEQCISEVLMLETRPVISSNLTGTAVEGDIISFSCQVGYFGKWSAAVTWSENDTVISAKNLTSASHATKSGTTRYDFELKVTLSKRNTKYKCRVYFPAPSWLYPFPDFIAREEKIYFQRDQPTLKVETEQIINDVLPKSIKTICPENTAELKYNAATLYLEVMGTSASWYFVNYAYSKAISSAGQLIADGYMLTGKNNLQINILLPIYTGTYSITLHAGVIIECVADVLMFESKPVITSNLTGTAVEGSIISFSCQVVYFGRWAAEMTWTENDTVISARNLTSTSDATESGTTRYDFQLKVTLSKRNTKYKCRAYFPAPPRWLYPAGELAQKYYQRGQMSEKPKIYYQRGKPTLELETEHVIYDVLRDGGGDTSATVVILVIVLVFLLLVIIGILVKHYYRPNNIMHSAVISDTSSYSTKQAPLKKSRTSRRKLKKSDMSIKPTKKSSIKSSITSRRSRMSGSSTRRSGRRSKNKPSLTKSSIGSRKTARLSSPQGKSLTSIKSSITRCPRYS